MSLTSLMFFISTMNAQCPSFYDDDFENSAGWTINPNGTDGITASTAGQFQIGNPTGTTYQNTNTNSGTNALVSGAPNTSDGSHDLDGGLTSALSPIITLPGTGPVNLQFFSYFAHDDRSGPTDFLRVSIVQGGTTTEVFIQNGVANATSLPNYTEQNIDLSAYLGQNIQILVEAQSTTVLLPRQP